MTFRVPKQKVDDYMRAQFAIETAFNELVNQARRCGLQIYPVAGLSHLPQQDLAFCFKEACSDILLSLTPSETHIKDRQGNEHWAGEDCS
jgi:hypothetical protein